MSDYTQSQVYAALQAMYREMEMEIIRGSGKCFNPRVPKEEQLRTLRKRRDERLKEFECEVTK